MKNRNDRIFSRFFQQKNCLWNSSYIQLFADALDGIVTSLSINSDRRNLILGYSSSFILNKNFIWNNYIRFYENFNYLNDDSYTTDVYLKNYIDIPIGLGSRIELLSLSEDGDNIVFFRNYDDVLFSTLTR